MDEIKNLNQKRSLPIEKNKNYQDKFADTNEKNESDQKVNSNQLHLTLKSLLMECINFVMFFGVIALIVILLLLWLNNNTFSISIWYSILFYPTLLLTGFLWIWWIQDRKFSQYFLKGIKKPKEGHRWLWILYSMLWIIFITIAILFYSFGWAYLNVEKSEGILDLIFLFIHACIGAPIVEEILFRGYLYKRAEDLWGNSKWEFILKMKRDLHHYDEGTPKIEIYRKYEITYPALFSSIIFGLYHFYPSAAIVTFIGGLLFCKARNDFGGTLIIPIIFHFSWNLAVGLLEYSTFTIQIPFLTFLKP